jgi:UDPglucose 6-dehydrogenase
VSKLEISIIGAGVVGCVTAVGLASQGHTVHLIESDSLKVSAINIGKWKPTEPNLGNNLKAMIETKQLTISSSYDGQKKPEVVFVCVGTPSSNEGVCDLSYLYEAIREVIQCSDDQYSPLIAVRSTTPPGTLSSILEHYAHVFQQRKSSIRMRIASNPEFLREGTALNDFLHPNRIVFGVESKQDSRILEQVYEGFEAPIIEVSISTAEMIKSASNAFLATRISFINEIGKMCKQLGIDTYEVARGLGYDERIGNQYLEAGLGFGGSCLPKDLRALIQLYTKYNLSSPLLSSVQEVNENQIQILANLAEMRCGILKRKRIVILGLSFKPGTDTIIESPSISLVQLLLNKGARITVHDPKAMKRTREVLGEQVEYADTPHEATHNADLVIIATRWKEYTNPYLYQEKVVIELNIPKGIYEGLAW